MRTPFNSIAANMAAVGYLTVSQETYEARLAICYACDWWKDRRCSICNCPMETKATIAATKCADNPPKWGAEVTRSPWFFGDTGKVALLKAELESWRGTKFCPAIGRSAKKGVACDCVSFVERVLVNLKAIQPISWPKYVTHGGGEAMLELLKSTLARIPSMIAGPFIGPQIPGDVFLVSSGKALHHLAIYAGDNTVWHAVDRRGVCTVSLFDPMATKHTQAVYRIKV